MDNMTGRQLRAEATATIFTTDRQKTVIGEVETDVSDSETIDVPPDESLVGDGTSVDQDTSRQPYRHASRPTNAQRDTTVTIAGDDINKPVNQHQCRGKRGRSASVCTKNTIGMQSRPTGSTSTTTQSCNTPTKVDKGTVPICHPNKKQARSSSVTKSRVWKKVDLKNDDSRTPKLTKPPFLSEDVTPTGLFEYFFDDDILSHIVEMSRSLDTRTRN